MKQDTHDARIMNPIHVTDRVLRYNLTLFCLRNEQFQTFAVMDDGRILFTNLTKLFESLINSLTNYKLYNYQRQN